MDPLFRRRIYNLLCIKSIVTLALTGLFIFLAVTGQVSARDFITIFPSSSPSISAPRAKIPETTCRPPGRHDPPPAPFFPGREHFSAFSSFFLTENRV